ncbi:hypothetical protein FRB99_002970 [Tulasnella sp. 403]|nr:hypothetical protein FRB99_002970 [Tulasnella sp. 403]
MAPKRKSNADESDDDYSDVPAPAPVQKKPRASKSKKDPFASARELLHDIIANPTSYESPDHNQLMMIAEYASALETGQTQGGAGTRIVKEKSPEELMDMAGNLPLVMEELSGATRSPTNVEYSSTTAAFQYLMDSSTPVTFKKNKLTIEEFEDRVLQQEMRVEIRYDTLRFKGDVNIKFNPDSGEFGFSGPSSLAPPATRRVPSSEGLSEWRHSDIDGQTNYSDAREVPFSQWENITEISSTSDHQSVASSQSSGTKYHASRPGRITFVSEDGKRMWRELTSVFTDDSEAFEKLIDYDLNSNPKGRDPIDALPGLRRDPVHRLRYHLKGITPWDLDALLTGLKPKLGQEVPFEQLCPMLVLATDWQFKNIRNYAIRTLPSYDDLPIPRIILARRAKVAEWLTEPYLDLALRLAPPTEHEASLLGTLSILNISKVREKVMERRLSLISGERPAVVLGKSGWWHSKCWYALTNGWRKALTEKYYRPMSPERAVMTALEDVMLANGRRLCRGCNSEELVVGWLNLGEDRRIAKAALQAAFGVTMEMWVP